MSFLFFEAYNIFYLYFTLQTLLLYFCFSNSFNFNSLICLRVDIQFTTLITKYFSFSKLHTYINTYFIVIYTTYQFINLTFKRVL
jgi:hypothetical protein